MRLSQIIEGREEETDVVWFDLIRRELNGKLFGKKLAGVMIYDVWVDEHHSTPEIGIYRVSITSEPPDPMSRK